MAKTLKSLAPGTTVIIPGSNHNGVPLILRKLADDHHAIGTTLLDTRDIISFIGFDGKEFLSEDPYHRDYGNNNYGLSNIRQYLNSIGSDWYTPQHEKDTAPNEETLDGGEPYGNLSGFLSAFPIEFIEHIATTALTTVVPGYNKGISTQNDKVFLLSRTEVGLGDEREAEGKTIPFFKDDNARLKELSVQAMESENLTYFGDWYYELGVGVGDPWEWWLRSPYSNNTYRVRSVRRFGTLGDANPDKGGSVGMSPAMNLPSNILVSDTPNAEGHYEIMFMLAESIGMPKIKIGTENKEILEMYLKVDGSNKAVIETNISINGTNKPWV